MLEVILDKHILWILMGIFTVLGVVSKCIANITLKRLVKAAGNMGKSTHALMRLVRAKFEHACMVSDKVQNVSVFVEKYLYEYKVAGVKLHRWRRLEKWAAWLCAIMGLAAAGAEYAVNGMGDQVLKNGAAGAGLGILLFLFHITTDENYQIEAAKNYMVDYLENVCAHRYEKNYQKEMKAMAPPEVPIPEINDPHPKTGVIEEPGTNAPSKDAPGYPNPREEVPSPLQSPEITPPVMPEPAKVPETAGLTDAGVMAAVPEEQVQQTAAKTAKRTAARTAAKTAARTNAKAGEKEEKKEIPKEVMIREILEEFLA